MKKSYASSLLKPLFVLAAIVLLATAIPAFADDAAEQRMFSKLFAAAPEKVDAKKIFTEAFLKAVPENKVVEILKLYRGTLGDFRKAVKGEKGKYTLVFEKGDAPATISLEASGRIAGLWFGNPALRDDSFDKLRGEFGKLEGTVSVIVRRGTEEILAINPAEPLAVGSAFKMWVLKALCERYKGGAATPETVVRLSKDAMSLPSGMMHSWAEGTPVTLQTLADMMISISDNTATDQLIDYLGRDVVERNAPERMRPFLKTLEMFRIKYGLSKEKRMEYVAAGLEGKREILKGLSAIERKGLAPDTADPIDIATIEWHATARELADIVAELREEPAMSINPGVADAGKWKKVCFKGGSEPGVLNLTHYLEAADGRAFAVATTINDAKKEVATDEFTGLVGRLIALLEKEGAGKDR